LILEFESGSKLVYKPRSIVVALHFQKLIEWINGHGLEPTLKTMQVLPREGYGWEEYVSAGSCRNDREARLFYQRQGALIALLYAVSATDVHNENIIASAGDPILVDHETLFQPEVSAFGKTRHERTSRAFAASLTADTLWHLAVLPSRSYSREGSPGIDISGLGGGDSDVGPMRIPTLVNSGRDDMHLEMRFGENPPQQNRPKLGTTVLSVYDYRTELLSGFEKMCRLLCNERDALLDEGGPLTFFARDRTRVLLRPTAQYALLLTSLGRPELLRDGATTDMHLDRFLSSAVRWKNAHAIADAERKDLWYGDVPAFYTRANSLSLWTSFGRRIDRFSTNSGLEVARRRVARLDASRVEALTWQIDAALDCSIATQNLDADAHAHRKFSSHRPARSRSTVEVKETIALELAEDLGNHIKGLRFDVDSYVNWPAVVDDDLAVSVQAAMGPSLYDGLSGVALFFAYLGELLNRDEFREIAHRAHRTGQRFVDSFDGPADIGAFTGVGGYLYLLLHLSHLWNDAALLRECTERAAELPEKIRDQRQYDFSRGTAGLVPVLLGLHQANPRGGALHLAEQCGWHLVKNASSQVSGVGWVPDDEDPSPALLGMAHGTSGIACSLTNLSRATGEQEFRRVAAEALTYERSLFDVVNRGWPDLRRQGTGYEPARHSRIAAWCHGAAGIGLARCQMADDLMDSRILDEIRVALELTHEVGFGNNHSLCHGDLGNLDLFLEAPNVLTDDGIKNLRSEVASNILSDLAENGYKTGITQGVDSVDLMRGAAGVGFGLLRIASPARVPSVLLLDPPRQCLRDR
jgi:type 2 lantibiotic biosynthesis protein LanM